MSWFFLLWFAGGESRCTPVEVLHTILLGPYKYLLKDFVSRLSPSQKCEVLAKMSTFNYSGFQGKVIGNLVRYYKSLVGRDYKAWAQMALFVAGPYLTEGEKKIWLSLSKVSNVFRSSSLSKCLYFSKGFQNCLLPSLSREQSGELWWNMPEICSWCQAAQTWDATEAENSSTSSLAIKYDAFWANFSL